MINPMLPRLKHPATGMEKVDRLGWAAGLCINAYGVRIGVRTNEPKVLDELINLLPPVWKPAPSPIVEQIYSVKRGAKGTRQFHLLYGGAERLLRTRDWEEALDQFDSFINRYVAQMARRRVFVHAGVVGWRGQAIVIPGRSFSGKSTLVEELIRAGATYYSDEYAVFDAHGRVHPYTKPLALRYDPTKPQLKFPVETIGGVLGRKPLPVGLVLVSQYTPEGKWRPQQLPAGQGVLALLANTIPAREQPAAALATFQHIVARAPVMKSWRGEAREVVEYVLERFDK